MDYLVNTVIMNGLKSFFLKKEKHSFEDGNKHIVGDVISLTEDMVDHLITQNSRHLTTTYPKIYVREEHFIG